MILDTSAVVAVVRDEPLTERLLQRALLAATCRISAANLLESYMVVDRSGAMEANAKVDRLVERVSAQIEPVTHEQVILARSAFHRYGKGSGHPARLNFGDCFAYALARFHNEPLLFIGQDFSATDIEPALPT
jgi:ribonuclease VapC